MRWHSEEPLQASHGLDAIVTVAHELAQTALQRREHELRARGMVAAMWMSRQAAEVTAAVMLMERVQRRWRRAKAQRMEPCGRATAAS